MANGSGYSFGTTVVKALRHFGIAAVAVFIVGFFSTDNLSELFKGVPGYLSFLVPLIVAAANAALNGLKNYDK